jgi:nucleotide-binding universal stress UspA family protein
MPSDPMANPILVSYDGTPNDDDALALAKLLAAGGAPLALAYVRHSREFEERREELAAHDAKRRLAQGAQWLGDPSLPQHVVIHASTWVGLAELAREIGASMIVFGSDYRTPPGSVSPGTSAQHLLEGGPVAVAVAPAGIRTGGPASITKVSVDGDPAATASARALAEALGASVVAESDRTAELAVISSRPGGPAGKVELTSSSRGRLTEARSAVLVVPAGGALSP